jgi:hypothetical protein
MSTRTFLQFLASALLLAALALPILAQNPPADSKPQPGDAAATTAAQPAKKPKHVYTDDDFASTRGSGSSGVQASPQYSVEGEIPKDPMTQKEFTSLQRRIIPSYQFNLAQTKTSVANLYLQQYKDARFEGRSEWEDRLFAEFECTRNAQGEYVKELQEVSNNAEYTALMAATKFSDSDLKKIGALRAKLIADWNPVAVCETKFDVIRQEGWQRADAWLKAHPSAAKTN